MLQTLIKNFRSIITKPNNYMSKITWNKFTLGSYSPGPIISISPMTYSLSASLTSSVTPSDKVTDGEKRIRDILERTFPNAVLIRVQDVSGGCGSMYTVGVQTKEFKGLPIIKQHRLVHEALKQEIKDMHGIQINTTSP